MPSSGPWKLIAALALVLAGASIYVGARLFSIVQAERGRNTLAACEKDNTRNREARATVDRQILERVTEKPVPENLPVEDVSAQLNRVLSGLRRGQRQQVEQSRQSTALIIGTLAPVWDCEAVVAAQVSSAPSLIPEFLK